MSYLNCCACCEDRLLDRLKYCLAKVKKISNLLDHDEILYCLESIYIDLYMCKVSYTLMLTYVSVNGVLMVSSKAQIQHIEIMQCFEVGLYEVLVSSKYINQSDIGNWISLF